MSDAWLWWFFIQMLGLACVPLAFSVFANLPDRGWALAKALGVLSFGFLVWFPLTLPSILPAGLSILALPYSQGTIIAFLLLLLAGNAWLLRYRWRGIVGFARRHPAYILLSEALFGAAFALLIWIRSFLPDISGTEKFMDEAFLSAIMRSPHLPPNDPWLSGYSLNYYYLGHFLLATIAKLLGTAPAVAFNTGIALIFGLMAVSLFGVTTNVVALLRLHRQRRVGVPARLNLLAAAPFGLAAVLLSLVFGNLDGASQWLAQLGAAVSFNGGLQNVLALTLAAGSVFGLVWGLVALFRPQFWRLKTRLRGLERTQAEGDRQRYQSSGLNLKALAVVLVFGLAVVVLAPWAVSRLLGIGSWLGVAWPQITTWLKHPLQWASYNWWTPSRAVQSNSNPVDYQNITEFPAFSFLLADLHAHVLALPFTVLALGVALNLLLARGRGLAAFGPTNGWRALSLVSGAVILGGLYAINGWDLPTYAGLALLCLAAQQWRAHGRQLNRDALRDFFTMAACWMVLGLLLYLPFILSFSSPSQGIGTIPPTVPDASGQLVPRSIVSTDRTSFADFWSMFGLFLSILGAFLLWQFVRAFIIRWRAASAARALAMSNSVGTTDAPIAGEDADGDGAEDGAADERVDILPVGPLDAVLPALTWGLLAAAIALALLTFVSYSLVLVTCLAGTAACGVLAYRRLNQPGLAFALILAGTALALVGVCEVVYLRDVFDHGELFRMNTIFKLYYQAWTLLSLSGGALLYELLGTGWRISWQQSRYGELLKEKETAQQPARARLVVARAAVGRRRETAGALAASEAQGAEALAARLARLESEAAASSTEEAGQQREGQEAEAVANESQPEADDQSYSHEYSNGRNEHAEDGAHSSMWRRRVEARRDVLSPGLRVLGVSGKLIWMVGFLVLVLGALVYPVFAANGRTGDYQQQVGLDGAQYLANQPLDAGDADAIRWINGHITGDPVIVEATGGEYTYYARISTFTGLPTILGWAGHEIQWRVNWLNVPANAADFNRRLGDINTIYTSSDAGLVRQLLQHYQASYLYVGALEQRTYPNVDLGHFSQAPFSSFLTPVYQAEGVVIYQIS